MEVERERKLLKFAGIRYPYVAPPQKISKNINPLKNLVLADLHQPFASWRVLHKTLEHKDARRVIIAGDLGDFYSKSRFRKTESTPFKTELKSVFKTIEWLSTNFYEVLIMVGNHDDRPQKYILGKIDGEVDLIFLTEFDWLNRFCSFFPNVKMVGKQVPNCNPITHIFQIGDCIITHAEISRMQETATMERISLQLFRWSKHLNLKPYRVIMQAHNHTASMTMKGDECWMHIPTASNPYTHAFDYIRSARMQGNPPQLGYTLLYQQGGRTMINETHWYLIGEK